MKIVLGWGKRHEIPTRAFRSKRKCFSKTVKQASQKELSAAVSWIDGGFPTFAQDCLPRGVYNVVFVLYYLRTVESGPVAGPLTLKHVCLYLCVCVCVFIWWAVSPDQQYIGTDITLEDVFILIQHACTFSHVTAKTTWSRMWSAGVTVSEASQNFGLGMGHSFFFPNFLLNLLFFPPLDYNHLCHCTHWLL